MHLRKSGAAGALAAAALLLVAGCTVIVGHFMLPRDGIREAQYRVQPAQQLHITTRDGVDLVSEVYRPQGAEKTATILVRIPFSNTFRNRLAADLVGSFWASRGYTVVIQGTRGRYKSSGDFYPLAYEREDGLETLQWLTRQPWFDGRLGMWGGSAFGHTQWVLADQSSPGPRALIIQIASTSFREMFHPGNAFSLESALFWAARSRGRKDEDPSFEDLQRGFDGFPLIEADDRSVGNVPFFDDWLIHSEPGGYWERIDGRDRARTIKAPVLLMAGWYDPFLPTQLRDFETIRREADPTVARASRLIVGPWTHADPVRFPDGSTEGDYRPASLAPSIAWFDHHLLGRPLDKSLAAPVRIFVMGERRWRDEKEWPLARTRHTAFYLGRSGLSLQPPRRSEPPQSYLYDPHRPVPTRGGAMLGPRAGIKEQNEVEARADVLLYSTPVLEEDMEVTGPIRAILHVATSAPSTDFTVKLVDVHPDGKTYNVSDGILRRAYQAELPTRIEIELWPTSMLFRRGHRVRVEVSSSNYPRYDRNPNTGGHPALERNPVPANQTLFLGQSSPSRIILPVIPR